MFLSTIWTLKEEISWVLFKKWRKKLSSNFINNDVVNTLRFSSKYSIHTSSSCCLEPGWWSFSCCLCCFISSRCFSSASLRWESSNCCSSCCLLYSFSISYFLNSFFLSLSTFSRSSVVWGRCGINCVWWGGMWSLTYISGRLKVQLGSQSRRSQ